MANQFMFYRNFFENVPEELRKEYCYALAQFVFEGELPEDPILKMMVKLVEPSLFNKGGAPVGNKNAAKKTETRSETTDKTTCQNNLENNPLKQPEKQPLYKTKTETETKTETKTESLGVRNDPPKPIKKACRFEKSEYCMDTLPDSFLEEAEKQGFGSVAEREYPAFRDYWTAKSGQDATKFDWLATWRNWLRNSQKYGGSGSAAVQNSITPKKTWREMAREQGVNV